MTKIQLKSENVTRENEEMMEEDGPLSITDFLNLLKPLMAQVESLPFPSRRTSHKGVAE